jgi:hypothetical protein
MDTYGHLFPASNDRAKLEAGRHRSGAQADVSHAAAPRIAFIWFSRHQFKLKAFRKQRECGRFRRVLVGSNRHQGVVHFRS